MCWKEYKSFKFLGVFVLLSFLFSCSNPNPETTEKVESEKNSSLSWEEQITRQIESQLSINAQEEYDIQFYYSHLNPDTLKDAIVLVNRREYAIEHVRKNGTESFFERMGYSAPQNYVFVVLGGGDKLISPQPIGSNINYPLTIEFLKLTSSAQNDFYVEYRVKNSLFRNYYTLSRGGLDLIFSCPVFDGIGEEEPTAYSIEHKSSPLRIAKDIAMYQGKIKHYNLSEIEDVNTYTPSEIEKTDSLVVYFIYDENKKKYITPMRPAEEEQ